MQVACPGCSNEMQNPYAIGFQLNKATPDLGRDFDQLARQVIEQSEEQLQLEITGKYYANEQQGKELGQQRATVIAKTFENRFPSDIQPILRSQKVWDNAPASDSFFQAIDMQWLEIPEIIPTIPLEKLFFFKKAVSATTLANEDQEYLNSLADYVNKAGKRVLINGYADNTGSRERNAELAWNRANFIADKLIDSGVSREQLIIINKNHAIPLVDNKTEANRAKNRRVFLKVVE